MEISYKIIRVKNIFQRNFLDQIKFFFANNHYAFKSEQKKKRRKKIKNRS